VQTANCQLPIENWQLSIVNSQLMLVARGLSDLTEDALSRLTHTIGIGGTATA
jgi:hypothetical protein